jgi:hypothetical protein
MTTPYIYNRIRRSSEVDVITRFDVERINLSLTKSKQGEIK